MLKCSRKVIVGLHCHQCLGGACPGLFQSVSEVRADTSFAVEDTEQYFRKVTRQLSLTQTTQCSAISLFSGCSL